ncbi:MAG: tetratricopeptide repeat protein [Nitrospirota bacterium]
MKFSKRWSSLLSIVSISLIIVVIYYNSLDNSFHYDDYHSIVENSFIRGIGNIPSFFLTTLTFSGYERFAKSYRPLLLVSYTINYYFGKLDPYGYHLVNIIIHLLCSVFLYLIVKEITGDYNISLLSGILFALMPINTDAVNYITARSSLLSTSFYLLSFLFFIYFRVYGRITHYFLFLISFAAALLSKEIAITLPVILFVYDCYFVKKEYRKGLKSAMVHLPFLITGIIYLIIRKIMTGTAIGEGTLTGTRDINLFYSSSLTAVKMMGKYIHLMFLPFGLSAEHELTTPTSIFESPVILSVVVLSLFFIILYRLFFKSSSSRIISFFILWFFITILPILILPFTGHSSIFQENRGYLSGISFAIISGILLVKLYEYLSRSSKRLLPLYFSILCLLLIFYSIGVVRRNSVWRNDLTLWSDVAKKYPMSYKAYHEMGIAYQDENKFNLAIENYTKVLSINPDYYLAYTNLGNIYYRMGRINLAMKNFQETLRINPESHKAHLSIGKIYHDYGRLDLAIKEFKEVLRINPNNYDARMNLGFIYQKQGRLDLTLKEYKEIIKVDPTDYEVLNNIGVIYIMQKRKERAIERFKEVIKINPDYIYAHNNLGRLYSQMGSIDLAIREYQEVLRIDPDFKNIKSTIDKLYERKKRKETPS